MVQDLTTQEVKNQKKEVGAMIQQDVKLYDQPIIFPVVVEEYEETIVEGVKVKIQRKRDYNDKEFFDVIFNNYVIRCENLNYEMAIYALLLIEKRLLAHGYVEAIFDWSEKDWQLWDQFRIFTYGEYKILREGNYEIKEGDAIINLKIRRIYAPLSENDMKVYIKAIMMPVVHIE